METKQNGGNQVININNSMLFKNDIWSFGCVML
jgi:hypothetical protein